MKPTDDMSTKERVEFWTMALGELKSSGLSKAEFCRQNGFRTSTLNYWQRRLGGRQTETATAPRFIESPPPVKRVARDAGSKPALLGHASRRWLSL